MTVRERLVAGVTHEDHWLEFKAESFAHDAEGRRKCLRTVAQFANASGGTVVIGAIAVGEVFDTPPPCPER
jgi:hypothetical protein